MEFLICVYETLTHVVDPKNPGAVDEIIHLGDYWDENNMITNKEDILRDNSEVGRNFRRAYGYLAAAKGVYNNIEVTMDEAVDKLKVNKIIEQLITEIFGRITYGDKVGKERHLFGSAITPEGIKDHIETIIEPSEMVFILKGKHDCAQSEILEKLGKVAIDKGYDVEILHNHFIPEKVDHIYIKDINISITTSNKFNNYSYKSIDVDSCLCLEILDQRKEELNGDIQKFDELISIAVGNIYNAKKVHDTMEKYYIPNMDFDAVDELREKTLDRILKWAEE